MALVTEWAARRAKRQRSGQPQRILCGWHAGATFCAAPPIAWVPETWSPNEIQIFLPGGLTDAGSQGVYRWSRPHRKQVESGRTPLATTRGLVSDRERVIGGELGQGKPMCIVPCVKNHMNRIDFELLAGNM